MATSYDTCLTDRVEDYLWDMFPCDKSVTDAGQRQIAKIISQEGDASARRNLANQVVEFLVVCHGVPVSHIVQELKNLYSHSRGRKLCKWQAATRAESLTKHPSNQKVLETVG